MRRVGGILAIVLTAVLIAACGRTKRVDDRLIYSAGDSYSVWVDSIVEGDSIITATSGQSLQLTTLEGKFVENYVVGGHPVKYPSFVAESRLATVMYNAGLGRIASTPLDSISTTDLSYSVYLSLALIDPAGSMDALKSRVSEGRIVTGVENENMWPIKTDRVIWGLAAWEVYKATGDSVWLRDAYNVLVNTLTADIEVCLDRRFNLFHGQQSEVNRHFHTYPMWMQPKDVYETMALSTNVLFATACRIVGYMGEELGVDDGENDAIIGVSRQVRRSINKRLWIPDRGYYSEYLYGSPFAMQSPAIDNLGQALAVVCDVAYDEMSSSIVSKTPTLAYGIPGVFPLPYSAKPYHEESVWPFVQSVWNLAASKVGNMDAFNAGVGALYRADAMGMSQSTHLPSAAGTVALPLRGFVGIKLTTEGVIFKPFVPVWLKGDKTIKGLKYRNATIDLTISGTGTIIQSFILDGIATKGSALFPADMAGRHAITIVMAGDVPEKGEVNVVADQSMPEIPSVQWAEGDDAQILNRNAEDITLVCLNGVLYQKIKGTTYQLGHQRDFTTVSFASQSRDGVTGLAQHPYYVMPRGCELIVQAERFATAGSRHVTDAALDSQLVELGEHPFMFDVEIPADGDYFVDVRYANGWGAVDVGTCCCVRALANGDGEILGPLVMPQRGLDDWKDLGYSNMLEVRLSKGVNRLQILYRRDYEANPSSEPHEALIDFVRLIKK